MANEGLTLRGKVKEAGFRGLAVVLTAIERSIQRVFGQKRIEQTILKNTQARFEPKGRNRFAQASPDLRPWVPITSYTLGRRKKNKDATQALVDTGDLFRAIRITRDRLDEALTVGVGVARVGIPIGSPQFNKGTEMQEGYIKRGRGGRAIPVPARPFIGVGQLELSAVGRFVDRIFAKVL